MLQQANHVLPEGVQEVGEQAVRVAADLAPHPLNQDTVVDVTRAGPALVGAPADQAAGGLTFGIRAAVRDGEALTGEGNGFDILLYRTGKVLYNDHDLGTPPLVVGLANLGTRRGVSSFLAWMCAITTWRTTYWRRVIIPAYARSVKLSSGCDAPAAPPWPINQYDRSPLLSDRPSWAHHSIWPGLALFRSYNPAYNTMIITEQVDRADAFIAAWLPGTEGQGVADVLFGDHPFTGKLLYTWPRWMSQVPLSLDKLAAAGDDAPLFPFGHGLKADSAS